MSVGRSACAWHTQKINCTRPEVLSTTAGGAFASEVISPRPTGAVFRWFAIRGAAARATELTIRKTETAEKKDSFLLFSDTAAACDSNPGGGATPRTIFAAAISRVPISSYFSTTQRCSSSLRPGKPAAKAASRPPYASERSGMQKNHSEEKGSPAEISRQMDLATVSVQSQLCPFS
eukprot:g16559.t1